MKYFRYHSAGDIIDEKYLKGMVKIARLHPEVRFLAYTKKYELVNSYMDKGYRIPKNLKLLFSNWTKEFKIENPYHRPMTYVDFGNDTNQELPTKKAFKCPGSCSNCKKCWTLKNTESIIFKKH